MTVHARVLHAAAAEGPVLALTAPLSFWGAFDPRTGLIIDTHHPQRGRSIAGTMLLMRETRGSGTAPGGLAEAIRLKTAPAAIILVSADVNLAIGAMVAETLYGRSCAVLTVSAEEFATLVNWRSLAVTCAGDLTEA